MSTQGNGDPVEVYATQIFNTVDTPVTILDRNGLIVSFNEASERLTGFRATEVIGKKVWDLFIIAEEVEAVRAIFERTRADGLPTHFTNYWKTKDNRRRLLEWSNKTLKDQNGEVDYVLATGVDITDTKSKEHQLIESQAFLRSIMDASPVAVITINERGSILSFSHEAEETFGYTEKDVRGQNVKLLMPEPDKSQHDGYLSHYLETGERRIIGRARSVTALRKNGEEFPAILHVSEFTDGERIFVGFVEDITEQTETERRLSDTQSQLQHVGRLGAMGELATSIAHELNQPLTAAASLAGAVSLTLKNKGGDQFADAQEFLEDAVNEIRRASEIIRNMREFVRKRKTTNSLHDINTVVEEASSIALIGAEAQQVKVTTNFASDAGELHIDRIQIQQVVTNLVRNAIDAMGDSPERHLTISTNRKGDKVEIRVDDTGPGITDEVKKRLFEPFVTSKEEGMGIGLSISKSIIDAHQGEIIAKNKDGAGCIFVVKLPAGNNGEFSGST